MDDESQATDVEKTRIMYQIRDFYNNEETSPYYNHSAVANPEDEGVLLMLASGERYWIEAFYLGHKDED